MNSAITAAQAGSTIYVREGTYSELGQANTCYPINKNVTIQAYNSEAVTLTYPIGQPPLYGGGPDYGWVISIGANVTLDGFTVVGMKDEGDQSGGYDVSITITSSGQGTIKNCTFRKAGHAAIKYGITSGDVTIEKNIFENTGHLLFDHHIYIDSGNDGTHKTIIRHNVFTDVTGYAIHLYVAPDNIDIYGNVIHACGGGHEVAAGWTRTEGGGIILGGTGHKVYNNTICNNYGLGGLLIWSDYSVNNEIKNNIIRDNAGDDLSFAADNPGPNTGAKNNIHDYARTGTGYTSASDVDTDPQFSDATPETWDDYRLGVGSPMIDAGVDVGAGYIAILDPAQTTRPTPKNQGAARDIGAFTT